MWGRDEAHFSPHRYIISVYAIRPSLEDDHGYHLEDRCITVRKYDRDAHDHILATEKQEILAPLRRVKAETCRRQRAPR